MESTTKQLATLLNKKVASCFVVDSICMQINVSIYTVPVHRCLAKESTYILMFQPNVVPVGACWDNMLRRRIIVSESDPESFSSKNGKIWFNPESGATVSPVAPSITDPGCACDIIMTRTSVVVSSDPLPSNNNGNKEPKPPAPPAAAPPPPSIIKRRRSLVSLRESLRMRGRMPPSPPSPSPRPPPPRMEKRRRSFVLSDPPPSLSPSNKMGRSPLRSAPASPPAPPSAPPETIMIRRRSLMPVEFPSRRRMRGRMLFIPVAPPSMPLPCIDPSRMIGRSLPKVLLLSSKRSRSRRGLLMMSIAWPSPPLFGRPARPPPRPPERRRIGRRSLILLLSSFKRVMRRRGEDRRSVEPPRPPEFMRVMMRIKSLFLLVSSSRSVMRRSGFERRSPPMPVPPCDMSRIGRSLLRDEELESLSRREMSRKVFMSRPGAAATATSEALTLGDAVPSDGTFPVMLLYFSAATVSTSSRLLNYLVIVSSNPLLFNVAYISSMLIFSFSITA